VNPYEPRHRLNAIADMYESRALCECAEEHCPRHFPYLYADAYAKHRAAVA
jgi:hypothetical protein